MKKLSVNVNKLATLRNSRGKNNPDVLKTTLDIITYGAQGITVHPRPDGRHIRKADVYEIAAAIQVEFNIEGYPDQNYLDLAKNVKPTQCTLVPDSPDVLTSNAGWLIEKNFNFLQKTVGQLKDLGIRTSLFIDPYQIFPHEVELLKKIDTDRIELYTEAYANAFSILTGEEYTEEYTEEHTNEIEAVLARYQQVATAVNQVGIHLNAGHDLNLENLSYFINKIPTIKEVSIGHALICDALYLGLEETIKRYLACLN